MVAMHHEIAIAVGAVVDRALADVDAAEMGTIVVAQELVVIAGHVDQAGALARLAQQLLHHVVVRLRPVPARAQLPAVDDVADEVDHIRIVIPQKIEQQQRLASARTEMHVGNEERAKLPHFGC